MKAISFQQMVTGLRAKRTLLVLSPCILICLMQPTMAAGARTVLFIGNSFTAGMHSPVWRYRASTVHDLNHLGVGGVPALFKLFTQEEGLNYRVYVETVPGKTLKYHYLHEKAEISHLWDVVVMQEYSALDPKDPGNPAVFKEYAERLAKLLASYNSKVEVWLMAPWSRPDFTYKEHSPWYGKPIDAMGIDLQHAYTAVATSSPLIKGVIPVGMAFNRAIAEGVADPDPYDGISYGKVNLWAYDGHHADAYGYYLQALMDFGKITGKDPRGLGSKEQAAIELGLAPKVAVALQKVAAQQLQH